MPNERENRWYAILRDAGFYRETEPEREEILKDLIRLAFDEDPCVIGKPDLECERAQDRLAFITIELTHAAKNVDVECGMPWWKKLFSFFD